MVTKPLDVSNQLHQRCQFCLIVIVSDHTLVVRNLLALSRLNRVVRTSILQGCSFLGGAFLFLQTNETNLPGSLRQHVASPRGKQKEPSHGSVVRNGLVCRVKLSSVDSNLPRRQKRAILRILSQGKQTTKKQTNLASISVHISHNQILGRNFRIRTSWLKRLPSSRAKVWALCQHVVQCGLHVSVQGNNWIVFFFVVMKKDKNKGESKPLNNCLRRDQLTDLCEKTLQCSPSSKNMTYGMTRSNEKRSLGKTYLVATTCSSQ